MSEPMSASELYDVVEDGLQPRGFSDVATQRHDALHELLLRLKAAEKRASEAERAAARWAAEARARGYQAGGAIS